MTRSVLLIALLGACGFDSSSASDASNDAQPTDAAIDGPPAALGVLFINEVMPSNTASCMDIVGEFDDWIELYNSGATAIALGGYTITDAPGTPNKVTLDASVIVPAHGFRLLWADDQIQGLDHLAFKLASAADSISLFAPDGTRLDTYAWTTAAPTDSSYARVPDGTGAFITTATPTCGATNGTP